MVSKFSLAVLKDSNLFAYVDYDYADEIERGKGKGK